MSRQSLHDWIKFTGPRSRKHRSRSHAPHRRTLRFEALEVRQLLSITVNTLVDEIDGAGVGHVSLRDAIAAAAPGETINFGVQGTILLTHGELTVNKNLSISGPGANLLTIDADGGSRVITVNDGNAGTLANVQISGLTITGGVTSGVGGGLLSLEALTVSQCWITGNRADNGGGIDNFYGTLAVIDCTISGNASTGVTGGGGGILNFSSSLGQTSSITNSTISGNTAATRGGGVNNFKGTLNIQFSTITNNTAPSGAGSGVSSWTDTNTTSTNFGSSIVAGNTGTDVDIFPKTFPPAQPTFHSLGYNLIGSGDAAQFFAGAGDPINVTAAALMLGPLADNGGPLPTHLPQRGSPAIDTGDPSAVANMGGVPHFDQRGTPYSRVFDGDASGGPRIDKGAVESDAVYFVVNTLLDGIVNNVSLRQAISLASTVTVGTPTIVFSPALTAGGPQTITLTDGPLLIAKSMSIIGPGASLLTIDANHASMVFNVDDGNPGLTQTVALSGLALTGGYNSNGGGAIFNGEQLKVSDSVLTGNRAQWGGGIYNDTAGKLTLLHSQITGNHAIEPVPGALGSGGGLYNYGGFVDVRDSTISGNDSVTHGGGILNALSGHMSIARSTVSDNTALGNGGGIANGDGIMQITDSTLSGNHATKGGGLLINTPYFDVTTISNSTFSGNVAPAGGGGIYNAGGQAVIQFCTITRNVSNDLAGSGVLSGPSLFYTPTSFYSSLVVANFDPLAPPQSAPYDVAVSGGENSLISLGYNIVGIGGFVEDTFLPESDQIIGTADPRLGPLANNGGATKTHALLPESPAIDAGNPDAVIEAGGVPLNDERGSGFRRIKDGDGDATATIDVGAFEQQTTLPTLLGDYNHNDVVDAADYTVWRDTLGQHPTIYAGADGNGSGTIDAADYGVWKLNFGHTPDPGSGSASSVALTQSRQSQLREESVARPLTANHVRNRSVISPAQVLGNSLLGPSMRVPSGIASLLSLPPAVISEITDEALLAWLSQHSWGAHQNRQPSGHLRLRIASSKEGSSDAAMLDAAWAAADSAEFSDGF
jgi:Chlamydia polymorphic membrane protein (Chlamydia_PMP) repeat